MPTDKSGKYHLNTQRMHAHEKSQGASKPMGGEKAPMPKEPMEPKGEGESQGHTTLHDHGDGSFHTEGHDGEKIEHPHIGHALAHMGAKHAGGSHMHIHHDGMSHTTNHAHEDGQVEGPHQHGDVEALKEHVGNIFGDGGEESEDSDKNDRLGNDYEPHVGMKALNGF